MRLANGVMTAKLKINPFIVTQGRWDLSRRVADPVRRTGRVRCRRVSYLGEGSVLHVPFVLLVLLAWRRRACAAGAYTHGRCVCDGSNPDAAFYAIPVAFHISAIYAAGGLLTVAMIERRG